MKTYKILGQKIKRLRKTKDISQKHLAKVLGYESDTAISLIEKGERRITVDKLQIISDYFSVPLPELLGEKREKKDTKTLHALLRSEGTLKEKDIEYITKFIESLKKQRDDKKSS